jgi:hypothetical protein
MSAIPGIYRRRVDVPNVLWESNFHPWEASPDLEYCCHRHELEWKDQVYCDIAFAPPAMAGTPARLMRCEFVNATDSPQTIELHLVASLQYPKGRQALVTMPAGAIWSDALSYKSFDYGEPHPQDGLVSDLLLRGEVRGAGFVKGSGLAFNRSRGDSVSYQLSLPHRLTEAALLLRYRAANRALIEWTIDDGAPRDLEIKADGDGFLAAVAGISRLAPGEHTLKFVSRSGGPMEIDGFVVAESNQLAEVHFRPEERNATPEQVVGLNTKSLLLHYPGLDHWYGVAWDFGNFRTREIFADDLDILMRYHVNQHGPWPLRGSGEGHFTDVYLGPVVLPPRSNHILWGLVCAGSRDEVTGYLEGFDFSSAACDDAVAAARSRVSIPRGTPAGQPYEFSQARMSATTLMNVVYPTYARQAFIKHNSPGRWWDSLYTWDSGFIGLGLLELDNQRAIDCLAAYVTEPGDPHAAFVHHGSPVPVQHYLFQQLWNRTRSRQLLEYFYPRLRQYHHFLSGRDPRSVTRRMKSNLLQTWDYFYNSGGWDDYPPQKHLHENNLAALTAPVSNTAHCIRTAKILRMAAREVGADADIAIYDEDIAMFTKALQSFAWDDDAGYFGYVQHTKEGAPIGFLRHISGANFNMGLDGVSPLIAGICTPEQQQRLLDHLDSEQALWTPIGLSTVDRSAPYYQENGYWNGSVWMPHQWFIWKALLDLGQTESAFRIAQTALRLWADEVGKSYQCFEHFPINSGRGAGWHHFSGLSTPVLCWFAAYYVPGNLNGGLDLWINSQEFARNNTALSACLTFDIVPSSPAALVAIMNPEHHYKASWRGFEIPVYERSPGTLELKFLPGTLSGKLEIFAIN